MNRRDFDLARSFYDPGCEYRPEQAAYPDSEPVYYGHKGLLSKFWRLNLESFDDVGLTPPKSSTWGTACSSRPR